MDNFQMEKLWNYESEYDNFDLFNSLSNTVMYQPLTDFDEIKPTSAIENVNFMSVFAGGKDCKNSLRLLSTEYLQPQESKNEETLNYFCMFSKNKQTNQKKYSLLPYNGKENIFSKMQLALDHPNNVLIINKTMLVAVQKKCITLYRIHNQHLILKDFDSIGIGNKMVIVQLQYLRYKGKEYLLVFGNEKEDVKPYFKCLVYEISGDKLKFIKKANLFQRQHYKPIIMFDKYPGKEFPDEMFCLVLGGYSDYQQQNYNFGALQIHLHLLIEPWIEYPIKITKEILFNSKHTITSGKALKITTDISRDEFWLLFCTEYQTITKLDFNFGQHDDEFLLQSLDLQSKTLKIRDDNSGELDPIYYSENTLYLIRVPESSFESKHQIPYRLHWCNKKMSKVCSRPLHQILRLFCHN